MKVSSYKKLPCYNRRMSIIKQHELGIAGLALLRNWLVGNKPIAKSIIKEIQELTKEINDKSFEKQKKVTSFNIADGYKAWADIYDNKSNLLIEVEEPIVKAILKKYSPKIALDAACGTGRYSELLNSLGSQVTGMDLSPAMLSKARKIRSNKINFIEGNLTSIPLKDASVDLAICALALTHLPRLEKALSELKRVVKPGGYIVISDIHPWLIVLGGQADFIDKEGRYGYVLNYVHWHSDYIDIFRHLQLTTIECIEPKMQSKHIKLAKTGFELKETTVAAALEGLPIALIWVLERQ